MKSWTRWALLPALAMIAASCGTSTEIAERWKEPTYHGAPADKVVIIGIGENSRRVKIFEDLMSQHFKARKITSIQGSSVITGDVASEDAMKTAVQGTGAQLAITCRLVGVDKETSYVPGSTAYVPAPYYYGYYPYYHTSYAVVSDPGYYTTYKVYQVESNVYDVQTSKLVWSGLSHTTDPANMEDGVNSLGEALIGELVREKIIK
jgi:hypothetical protein